VPPRAAGEIALLSPVACRIRSPDKWDSASRGDAAGSPAAPGWGPSSGTQSFLGDARRVKETCRSLPHGTANHFGKRIYASRKDAKIAKAGPSPCFLLCDLGGLARGNLECGRRPYRSSPRLSVPARDRFLEFFLDDGQAVMKYLYDGDSILDDRRALLAMTWYEAAQMRIVKCVTPILPRGQGLGDLAGLPAGRTSLADRPSPAQESQVGPAIIVKWTGCCPKRS
jgi:hypothetical protein